MPLAIVAGLVAVTPFAVVAWRGPAGDAPRSTAAPEDVRASPSQPRTAPSGAADANATSGTVPQARSPGQVASDSSRPSATVPRRTVRTPSGAVVTLPAPPASEVVPAGRRCTPLGPNVPPQLRGEMVPPSPGLTARRLGGERVEVRYELPQVPDACTPTRILVSVDVNSSPAPAWTQNFPIRGGSGAVVVAVPDGFGQPDVAIASVFTNRGVRSSTATVRIR